MATIEQLTAAYTAVHDGIGPDDAARARLQYFVQLSQNQPADAAAMSYIVNSADGGMALAALSYQFFTGKAPTKAGLDYLVNSPDNPSDLNDRYYSGFNLENRYINFAANLGVQGEGAAVFATKYGSLSFADYVASIYQTIIGSAYATAAGVDPAKAIADIVARKDAILATVTITPNMTQAQIDLALKAATAGYLLGEAIKADVGIYASAANSFMVAVATGTATYGADLVTTYAQPAGQLGAGAGQPVAPNFNFPTPVVTPPPEPPKTVDTARAFLLTTGSDSFTGGALGDTFTGAATLEGSVLDPASTFDPAHDVLDGGGGVDTLSLTISGGAVTPPTLTLDPTRISNIERLSVTTTPVGSPVRLVLTGTSFSELSLSAPAGPTTFTGYGTSVTKLALSDMASGNVTFAANITALAGHADALTLTLTNVGASAGTPTVSLIPTGTANTDWYETLNIILNGPTTKLQLSTGTTQTSLAQFNISGTGSLTLGFSSTDRIRLTPTIDASATTGGVTIGSVSATLGAADQTVKLGSGDDVVFFGANLDANDTVDGGAGTDTLSVGAAVTTANFAHVSNFETIRFAPSTASYTQDVTLLPTGLALEVSGAPSFSGALTLTNLANATSLTFVAGASNMTLAMGLANSGSASDALTLRFAHPVSGTAAVMGTLSDIAGLETLNIVSSGSGTGFANSVTTDNVLARQVITGDQALSLGNVVGAVDASGFAASLTLTVKAAINGVVIGGTSADTLVGNTGADTFTLGAQGQNAQSGADAIYTGGGSDTVRFVGNVAAGTGAATSYGAFASIKSSMTGNGNVSNLTLGFSADDHDFSLKNAAGTAFTGLAKGAVAHGLTAGDTLIVQNLATNAGIVAATANVALINLTGSTVSLATSGDIKQMFADAIASNAITGLAADANYLVAVFDNSAGKTVYAVVNTGASGAGDTTLSAADFTDSGIALIGHVNTSALNAGVSFGAAF